jgi:hypothetical protein
MYYLINEQDCVLLGLKPRARIGSAFRPNKTRPASLLNGFKHDYKFNIDILPYNISILYIKNTNEDTTTIDTALLVFFI